MHSCQFDQGLLVLNCGAQIDEFCVASQEGDDDGELESDGGGNEGGAEESGEQSQGPENGAHENGDGADSETSDLLGETVEVAGRKRLCKARD